MGDHYAKRSSNADKNSRRRSILKAMTSPLFDVIGSRDFISNVVGIIMILHLYFIAVLFLCVSVPGVFQPYPWPWREFWVNDKQCRAIRLWPSISRLVLDGSEVLSHNDTTAECQPCSRPSRLNNAHSRHDRRVCEWNGVGRASRWAAKIENDAACCLYVVSYISAIGLLT